MELPNGHSYWYPRHHVSADPGILRYLVSMVDENPEVTINDFGAGVGQYVNNHSSQYLVKLLDELGYDYDEAASVALRAAATYRWFQNTIHIFRRR